MTHKILSVFLLCLAASSAAQVTLESPKGGWRHSGGESAQHLQDVHYPASRVNSGASRRNDDGQGLKNAISGKIAMAQKAGAKSENKPHLLVINGVPMPLSVDPLGQFARPYAFSPGSNSVEVVSADRKFSRRVHFYDANQTRQKVGLRIVLSWDSDQTDVDLHVISPDGEHVFFAHRVGKNGGALDVDVTGGYGPEIYAIVSPPKGIWQVYVNYFGGGYLGGMDGELSMTTYATDLTIAQVAIIKNENTPDEKKEVFRVPLRRPGDLTLIRSFTTP